MNTEAKTNLMEMAARIREMREIIGYSVEQMAEKTEVSVEEYRAVEAGEFDDLPAPERENIESFFRKSA